MEELKKYVELEIGVFSEYEFEAALPEAERKLHDIHSRFGTPTSTGYLALLVSENINRRRFSHFCEKQKRERKPTPSGNSTNSHACIIPQPGVLVNTNVTF